MNWIISVFKFDRYNKAAYTAAFVAGGWAGAVMSWEGAVMNWAGAEMRWAGANLSNISEIPKSLLIYLQMAPKSKKVKWDRPTDRQRDRPTDRPKQ